MISKSPELYEEYARFVATPKRLRSSASLPITETEFAELNNVNRSTLWHWRMEDEFGKLVRQHTRPWTIKRTPNISYALAERAEKTGRADEVKLWHQLYEGFNEKSETKLDLGKETLMALLHGPVEVKDGQGATAPENSSKPSLVSPVNSEVPTMGDATTGDSSRS